MHKYTFAIVLLLLSVLHTQPLQAQEEANHWYFGRNVGVEFQNGVIVKEPFPTKMLASEGCASYSYPNTGSLMFYTDGLRVWGADNEVMPGSDYTAPQDARPQIVTGSTTQPALVVPQPGNPDIVYVFNSGNHTHLTGREDMNLQQPFLDYALYNQYSVVDLRLRDGIGDVVERVQLEPRIEMSERLTGTVDCLDEGYWVVTRSLTGNSFYTYRVTADGVQPEPIVSQLGYVPSSDSASGVGQMKISPDGSLLAVAWYGEADLAFELFDFNRVTGELSNPRMIGAPIWGFTNNYLQEIYGLTFSPECKYIYMSSREGEVLRFSLDDKEDAQAIENSTTFMPNGGVLNDLGALQIGPDGDIYVAQRLSFNLGRIPTPDAPTQFLPDDVEVGGRVNQLRLQCTQGLPNFMDHIFNKSDKRNSDCDLAFADFELSESEICAGDCIDIVNTTRGSVTGYEWLFTGAEPASSSAENPGRICFNQPGEYEIRLVITHPLVNDTARKTVRVLRNLSIEIEGPQAITICRGESLQLNLLGDEGQLSWSAPEIVDDVNSRTPTIRPQESGVLRVELNAADACEPVADEIDIVVVDPPNLAVDPIAAICEGEQVQLNASGALRYEWSPAELFDDPSSPTPTVTARAGTEYKVRGSTGQNCEQELIVDIQVLQNTLADAQANYSICRGESVQLSATGGVRYEWSPRSGLSDFTSPTPVATPQENTQYSVRVFNAEGCSAELPVEVTVLDSIAITLSLPEEQLNEPGSLDSIPVIVSIPADRLPLRGIRLSFEFEIDKNYYLVEGMSNDVTFTSILGPQKTRVVATFEGDITAPETILTHVIGRALLNTEPRTDMELSNVNIEFSELTCAKITLQNGQYGIHEYCLGYNVRWRALLTLRVLGNPVTGSELNCVITMPDQDDVTIELIDLQGISVLTTTIQNDGSQTVELAIDISGIASGLYNISARSASQSTSQTVLISR